jgi:hypothetical protein
MKKRNNEDSVWKEAVETYFEEFINFFFKDIAEDIDFDKGYEFLDKELEKITKDAEIGKRFADILVKVYLKNDLEMWLLIHIEIQGYYEKDFAERMYIYNYRIFDRYKKDVVSLAILADNAKDFRPNKYEVKYWKFRHTFEFPIVKLLDYKDKWEELDKSRNPFAIIVMAHFKENETKKNVDERLFWKITLVKKLYEKGFLKQDILLLYKFIDWLVNLPDDLNLSFHNEIVKYEEEKKMPYITTAEKIGLEKGIAQGLEKGMTQGLLEGIEFALELKFGFDGLKLMPEIRKMDNIDTLKLIKEAIRVGKNIDDVRKIYSKATKS